MKTIIFFLFTMVSYAQIGSKIPTQKTGLSGTWINKDFGYDMKLQLNENGKGVFEDEAITYTVVGNKINMKFEEETIAYNYKLSGNTLTLSGGDLDSPVSFFEKWCFYNYQKRNDQFKLQNSRRKKLKSR